MDENVVRLFKTSFIGNIATLERELGSLWGHGKAYTELTTSEKNWRETWKKVREEILDHSNKQLRKAIGEGK